MSTRNRVSRQTAGSKTGTVPFSFPFSFLWNYANNVKPSDKVRILKKVRDDFAYRSYMVFFASLMGVANIGLLIWMNVGESLIDAKIWHEYIVIFIVISLYLISIYAMAAVRFVLFKKHAYELGINPVRCWHCGYLTKGNETSVCPECGSRLFCDVPVPSKNLADEE